MKSDKDVKKEFKVMASKKPAKYYPVKSLKELGFNRDQCSKCGTYFWSIEKRTTCGDAACVGGFDFIGKSPAKRKLTYTQTWQDFSKIHKNLGYKPIARYPVVARWRDDTDFVQAGIYNFQPWVVSGEVKPPAEQVVEPQFCVRFNDIDNVGITGAHYVGFVMLGEHAFKPPEKFDFNRYLKDHLEWINKGMGLNNHHLVLHEDVWAGGGNFGSSIEFFSRGLEISNQVYMTHEVTPAGPRELKLKVLDMGQGMERVPWFTFGKATSYETTFPSVMQKLRKETGVKLDENLVKKFMSYAAWLNVDEVKDIDKAWSKVARKVGLGVKELREKILPLAALYSVAEHSRSLLVTLNDGALPSNVGGGYNLRVILRRALSFIDQYDWDLYLPEICKWHVHELKKLFPELQGNLKDVRKILDVEKSKYEATRQKSREIVSKVVKMKLTEKKLLELYDSKGITPEVLREEGEKLGIKVKVSDNFYAKVAALHEKKEKVMEKKEKFDINTPETKALYFDDWSKDSFSGKVLWLKDNLVILDKTVFYPRSGGQENDLGVLGNIEVVDVFKQGGWIIHKLKSKPSFKIGAVVKGKIDLERRKQLTQHHTAAHIINTAARRVLGNHINQAGAKKSVEKGHLDITHYESLSDNQIIKIQDEANKIVAMKLPVASVFMGRDEAEKKFGMRIYQGGAVPGKTLRIVEIADTEAEACGGTHLKNTSEADEIKIVGAFKIADDVVRIEYKAGMAAQEEEAKLSGLSEDLKKLIKKEMKILVKVDEDQLKMAADEFSVPVNQLLQTFEKFMEMVKENFRKLEKVKFSDQMELNVFARELFEIWKKQKKEMEKLSKEEVSRIKGLEEKGVLEVNFDVKEMRNMVGNFKQILLLNKAGSFVYRGSDKLFEKLIIDFGAKGGGKDIKQGMVDKKKIKEILKKFKF